MACCKGHAECAKRLLWAGAVLDTPKRLGQSTRWFCAHGDGKVLHVFALAVVKDHAAVVSFNLCCLRARRQPGHALHAFGAEAYDVRRRQIESYLVPRVVGRAGAWCRPDPRAREAIGRLCWPLSHAAPLSHLNGTTS